MLSGRAPSHARSRDESPTAVIARIKAGEFDFHTEPWSSVSHEAKLLTKGLLTVDPRRRLRMTTLLANPWVKGFDVSATPLMTPDVLTAGSSNRSAEMGIKHAFNAFHQAHTEGFRLQDVVNAKLAQRRRLKKKSFNDVRICSTSSSFSSSSSSGHSSIQTPSSHPHLSASSSRVSSSPVKRTAPPSKSSESNVFNFGEMRVKEYLSSLSSESSDSSHSGPLFLRLPPVKKRKDIPIPDSKVRIEPVAEAGPSCSYSKETSELLQLQCRLSQTEFGQEVGSYEQVSDRLPSVSDCGLVEDDGFQVDSSEQFVV